MKSERKRLITSTGIIILLIVLFAGMGNGTTRGDKKVTEKIMNTDFKDSESLVKPSFVEGVKMTWDFIFGGKNRVPDIELPYMRTDLSFLDDKGKGFKSAWLSHSTILMNADGKTVLTDPVFERKVTIVGPSRFNKNYPIDPKDLKHIDVVIISHNHYDHLNKGSIKMLKDITGVFVVSEGIGEYLKKWGVDPSRIKEMVWMEEFEVSENFKIIATPAQHFSGRGLFDGNKTLWSSWVISTESHKIFFSGDTGYFDGFKKIGEKFGPFDVTFLECGAYNKSWHPVHMFPEETVKAHKDLKGKFLHPIHNSTFNLAMHPWYEPLERVAVASIQEKVDLVTPLKGEVVNYESNIHSKAWWENFYPVEKRVMALGENLN